MHMQERLNLVVQQMEFFPRLLTTYSQRQFGLKFILLQHIILIRIIKIVLDI
jgi:hypothetical protein